MPAPHRSTLPTVPGIPVGAAVLIAVACTFLGFLIDAHGDATDLTGTFAALYIVGCVAAVLAVRYRGLFTTMVLPPLLLSIAVPLAYQQLTGRPASSIKDVLLNLAVPLVQRFPTMMLATVLVLMIGGGRILLQRRIEQADSGAESRRGESWGRSSAKRPRGGRERGSSLTDSARRRTRRPKDDPDEADLDEITPRPSRRTATAPVADAPPRVAGSARPRDGRPAARGAARPTAAMPRTPSDPARGNTPPPRRGRPPPPPPPPHPAPPTGW